MTRAKRTKKRWTRTMSVMRRKRRQLHPSTLIPIQLPRRPRLLFGDTRCYAPDNANTSFTTPPPSHPLRRGWKRSALQVARPAVAPRVALRWAARWWREPLRSTWWLRPWRSTKRRKLPCASIDVRESLSRRCQRSRNSSLPRMFLATLSMRLWRLHKPQS